eukprot:766854-Hanusia_phi.AAC.4
MTDKIEESTWTNSRRRRPSNCLPCTGMPGSEGETDSCGVKVDRLGDGYQGPGEDLQRGETAFKQRS